jgi:hypothetical protein
MDSDAVGDDVDLSKSMADLDSHGPRRHGPSGMARSRGPGPTKHDVDFLLSAKLTQTVFSCVKMCKKVL